MWRTNEKLDPGERTSSRAGHGAGAVGPMNSPANKSHDPLQSKAVTLVKGASTGCVVGLVQIAQAAALASLIFAGPMAPGLATGTFLVLLSSVIPSLLWITTREVPEPIFLTLQNAPLAVLIPALIAVGASAADGAAVPTVFAIFGITAFGTGLAFLAIRVFHLGRYLRILPYSVATGFLASCGALLVVASLQASLPSAPGALGLTAYVPAALAVVFAALLAVARRIDSSLGIAMGLILGILLTHAGIWAAGIDIATARELGILRPEPLTQSPLSLSDLARVDVALVLDAAPVIAAAVIIGLVGAMLNLSGSELVLGRDLPDRRIFGRMGLANLTLGAIGAPPGYISATATSIGKEIGGEGRFPILACCVVIGIAGLFLTLLLDVLPPFVRFGLLVFVGAALIERWFLRERRSMTGLDWMISGSFIAITLAFGIVVAIQVGFVVASVTFAVSYARLKAVRSQFDLSTRRSRVDRGPRQSAWLDSHGGEAVVLTLQGYLFFGSVEQVVDHVRQLLGSAPRKRQILLDFARVRNVDAAASAAMMKLSLMARQHGVRVVFCELLPEVFETFDRAGVFKAASGLQHVDTLDAALEDAEEAILAGLSTQPPREGAPAALQELLGSPALAEKLLSAMTRMKLRRGEHLIRQGEDGSDIYIVDTGQLAIQVPGADSAPLRLRSVRSGAFVGEMAGYIGGPRGADVVAEIDTVVFGIDEDSLERLRADDPALVAEFHRTMAAALAEKLLRTNRLLQDLN